MRSRRVATFVTAGCFCVCFVAWCQAPPHGTIVAGQSVAGVKLESSLNDFKAVFPKTPDDTYYAGYCDDTPMAYCTWIDPSPTSTGVYAYLKNGKIYQISVQTPRLALSNGIKFRSSQEQVRRIYPNGKLYVLLHSANKINGTRDLRYWVDRRPGIAFEFYWDSRYKQHWRVSSIDIFSPGADYHPNGCVFPPQEWVEMKAGAEKPR